MGLGFLSGLTFSSTCPEYLYLIVVDCFIAPHWRYKQRKNELLTSRHALNTTLLNSYVLDTATSFLMFWIMIGPSCYKTFVDPNFAEDEKTPNKVDDTFVEMLKRDH